MEGSGPLRPRHHGRRRTGDPRVRPRGGDVLRVLLRRRTAVLLRLRWRAAAACRCLWTRVDPRRSRRGARDGCRRVHLAVDRHHDRHRLCLDDRPIALRPGRPVGRRSPDLGADRRHGPLKMVEPLALARSVGTRVGHRSRRSTAGLPSTTSATDLAGSRRLGRRGCAPRPRRPS